MLFGLHLDVCVGVVSFCFCYVLLFGLFTPLMAKLHSDVGSAHTYTNHEFELDHKQRSLSQGTLRHGVLYLISASDRTGVWTPAVHGYQKNVCFMS